MGVRKLVDLRPVRFASPIHHGTDHPNLGARGQQFGLPTAKAVVLQMVVRIV